MTPEEVEKEFWEDYGRECQVYLRQFNHMVSPSLWLLKRMKRNAVDYPDATYRQLMCTHPERLGCVRRSESTEVKTITPEEATKLCLTEGVNSKMEGCETCRFWNKGHVPPDRNNVGSCTRYPPVLNPVALEKQIEFLDCKEEELDKAIDEAHEMWFWMFPVTDANDLCGEYKRKR